MGAYALALDTVACTCRDTARSQLGVDIPELVVDVRRAAPGGERISTDYCATITVEAADARQFVPPTEWRWIYGVAHEAAHIVVAQVVGPGRMPPVVWDEALAHFVATRAFLPAVWAEHGPALWPDPYPDYVTEGALPPGCAGHFQGYLPSLRALDARLAALANQEGVPRLVAALGALRPQDMRVDRFGAALERRCR